MRRFWLPATWLAGAALIWFVSAPRPVGSPIGGDGTHYNVTYYLIAHAHYGMSLALTFVVFAAVYLGLEALPTLRPRPLLAAGHLVLMWIGAVLILAPGVLYRLSRSPERFTDARGAFALLNTVSLVGYLLTLASLVVFAGVLIDGLVRRLKRRAPAEGA